MSEIVASADATSETTSADRGALLRERMVAELRAEGTILSASVAAAMSRVRREVFAPGVEVDVVYKLFSGVVTKRDANGTSTSSVSAPQVQAHMLEQAGITEGMRVLEIGSGGYNAALLAELVGPTGEVVTVDIDPDITERASRLLDEAGYPHVRVVRADAEFGLAEHAPYDRILVTVGAWDIPPAWISQLVEGGRLVVPLRMRGLSRTIAFERVGEHLVSLSSRQFGFVEMQGAGAHHSTLLVMRGGEITVRLDDDLALEPRALDGVFTTPRVELWTGVSLGRFEPWADTQMWLAATLPGFCRVVLDKSLDTGVLTPPGNHSVAVAVVDQASLAYVTTRSATADTDVEFGVHAYGPQARHLAERVAEQLRIWGRERRDSPGPRFWVHPISTPREQLPTGHVVNKTHSTITISWPPAANAPAGRDYQCDHTEQGE